MTLDPARASGLLTQGSFLAEHAKADQTSPVLRGKFVRQQLFCTPPPPPPPDIVVQPPTVDPRLTTRQRFAQHTADESCAACHMFLDPIGFTFEHYDAAGRWRDTDGGGQAVDATGELTGTDVDGALDGVASLARASPAATRSPAARRRNGSATRSRATSEPPAMRARSTPWRRELNGPNGDFRKMVRATVRMAAFRNRPPQEVSP